MLPDQVCGLAAPGPSGPIFASSYDGGNLSTTVLTAVDLDGKVLWRRTVDGHPGPPRVSDNGTVWVAHLGPAGPPFTELDVAGAVLREVIPECEPFEHLGAFAVLPDGFCAMWLPADRFHAVPPGCTPRIARHGEDGACRWSAPAVLGQLSSPGVLEISADTDWQVQPKKAWTPRTLQAHYWEPLLVSGHRVAATFEEDNSGIAVTFLLDTATGRLVATTRPGPSQHKAIIGRGEFLIGSQGYDAFTTAHYDASGAVAQEWPTHAMLLVDRHGGIRGPEYENRLPSRSRFVGLNLDGTVRRGPALSGYDTSYPALDSQGTTVFWRDGHLLAVDADFTMRVLIAIHQEKRRAISRIMLFDRGRLAFALHNELFILQEASLGPLDSGVWPCADGGLHGNPVAHQ